MRGVAGLRTGRRRYGVFVFVLAGGGICGGLGGDQRVIAVFQTDLVVRDLEIVSGYQRAELCVGQICRAGAQMLHRSALVGAPEDPELAALLHNAEEDRFIGVVDVLPGLQRVIEAVGVIAVFLHTAGGSEIGLRHPAAGGGLILHIDLDIVAVVLIQDERRLLSGRAGDRRESKLCSCLPIAVADGVQQNVLRGVCGALEIAGLTVDGERAAALAVARSVLSHPGPFIRKSFVKVFRKGCSPAQTEGVGLGFRSVFHRDGTHARDCFCGLYGDLGGRIVRLGNQHGHGLNVALDLQGVVSLVGIKALERFTVDLNGGQLCVVHKVEGIGFDERAEEIFALHLDYGLAFRVRDDLIGAFFTLCEEANRRDLPLHALGHSQRVGGIHRHEQIGERCARGVGYIAAGRDIALIPAVRVWQIARGLLVEAVHCQIKALVILRVFPGAKRHRDRKRSAVRGLVQTAVGLPVAVVIVAPFACIDLLPPKPLRDRLVAALVDLSGQRLPGLPHPGDVLHAHLRAVDRFLPEGPAA